MDNLVEKQREHFNEISEKYFQARSNPNHLLLKELIWKSFFKRNSKKLSSVQRVLEPMCGMAEGYEILRTYLNQSFNYFGFDYSENMVEIAKKKNPQLNIVWNDVVKFKADTGQLFDLIILIGGLHHVYSRTQEVIINLSGSLEKNGYFISFEPTHDNFIARRIREKIYKDNPLFDEDTEQGFEFKDLNKFFEMAGFEKVDQVYPGLLAYILYYNPDAFPNLNLGGRFFVKLIFMIDKLFWSNFIGRKLSFATMTLWKVK